MTRYLIDGLAIAALTLTLMAAPPARAEGGGGVLGLLLGVGTVYAIGKGIEQARAPLPEAVAQPEALPAPVAVADLSRPAAGWGRDGRVLPRDCLSTFQTWHGEMRGFDRSCLARNMRGLGRLPAMCAIDTRLGSREATIYAARCLQLEGWEIGRSREAGWPGRSRPLHGWERP